MLELPEVPQSEALHLSRHAAPLPPTPRRPLRDHDGSLQPDNPIPQTLIRLGKSETTEDELNCKRDFRDTADRKCIRL